jgi:hypothetical protein
MRPPWPVAAAALVCAALLLVAVPSKARVELPPGPGKLPTAAESGGRSIPEGARRAGVGCTPAAIMMMFNIGWWAPFPLGGCLGLQQIEQQTRLSAGLSAAVLAERQTPRASRLATAAVKRALIIRRLGNRRR